MDDSSRGDGERLRRSVSRLRLPAAAVVALLLLMARNWFDGQNMAGSAMLSTAAALWVGVSAVLHLAMREGGNVAPGAATPAVHAPAPAQDTIGPDPTRPPRERRGNPRPGFNGFVLLAVAVPIALVSDRPWNAPWWPGRHEASQLPSACVAGAPAAARLTPDASVDGSERLSAGYGPGSRCVWRDRENGATLVIDYVLGTWDGTFGSDATTNARRQQALNIRAARSPGSRSDTITGLGDEAIRVWRPGDTVYVLVRRVNVALSVSYSPAPSPGRNADEVDAISLPATERAARDALAHGRLDEGPR